MHTIPTRRRRPLRGARAGFTLVELLTVVFIIGALIAILVPSISSARNQAKKVATSAAIRAIEAGLQLFKADNGRDFPQTNGYPPSFAHPVIRSGTTQIFSQTEAIAGKFPFVDGRPTVSGAHWLPAMLMGVDQQGYISRKTVPKEFRNKVETWYTADGPGDQTVVLERSNMYVDPGNVRTTTTEKIRGRANSEFYRGGEGDPLNKLTVILDLFDQPILYYAANTHGRDTNMVEDVRVIDNKYTGGPQAIGPPYYFHQDNVMFTGDLNSPGWNFGGTTKPHAIARAGEDLTAPELTKADVDPEKSNLNTFARYICDRKLLKTFTSQTSQRTKLRPVNLDTYLLISAGVDGLYGTVDDPKNFPSIE